MAWYQCSSDYGYMNQYTLSCGGDISTGYWIDTYWLILRADIHSDSERRSAVHYLGINKQTYSYRERTEKTPYRVHTLFNIALSSLTASRHPPSVHQIPEGVLILK